ncbi:E3 ubiquitin-protein ligase MIB2-like [Ostrea edulis]|uniref:E3 ubiquitin-protein ligase MIB2-like n=1 Tax=Ostrea edulis TaxID=37623 RepID=UPI0024AEB627|nr:E3 ubiquitin-protein ligase MIB2-like [Ostrea edulis]
MASIKPGARVVRGPDWASKKQDSGEGFLGTIIFVPKSGSNDNKVTVIWDSGIERRYRAGHKGKYDLRVYDTAPTGIVHDHIVCDVCNDTPVKGIRWKCTDCEDFDLCNLCYMNDKHDTGHGFVRIDTQNSSATPVPPRTGSKSIQVFGLFPKAEVMRGPHWKWKNDDGGEGEVGRIQEVVTWNKKYHRGGVKVMWKNDSSMSDYRVGAEGCVDIIFTRVKNATSGGKYYPDHLSVVDVEKSGIILLKSGDKVRVNLTQKAFKQLQDNAIYGGWDVNMDQCIKELGTIVQILYNGKTCRVQYVDGTVWSINRVALTKIHTFTRGEAVSILSDYNAVRDLQSGHGGWIDDMKSALGGIGRVVDIDQDGDIHVKIDEKTWVFSPVCILTLENPDDATKIPAIPAAKSIDSNTSKYDVSEGVAKIYADLKREQPDQVAGPVAIFKAAGQGDLQTVKEIIRKYPDAVDRIHDGTTALQISCYEGHVDVVEFLLKSKANPNVKDSDGDCPLHYSAHGNEPKAMETLLKNGAVVNLENKKRQTPLHISVGKSSHECVKVLLEHKANPSLKDDNDDTAMHDAISQNQPNIVKDVLGSPLANYKEINTNSFNVLQWATMKNSKVAVDTILKKNTKIVDDKTTDDFTALHLAAVNDYVEIASALITRGGCDKNARDKSNRTPLIICVAQRHERTMEVLIAAGCDVNAEDSNGNTALHVAQIPNILSMFVQTKSKGDKNVDTKILCALLEAKADIYIKNLEGKSPLDLADDERSKQFMIKLSQSASAATLETTKKGIGIPSDWEKMAYSEPFKRVPLSPHVGGMVQKEYEMVVQKFQKTLGQAKILQIERIQNVFIWECYQLKRRQMEFKYGGIGCSNERELFHGTVPEILDVICKDNFDFRLAGERVGALLGQGSYFARDAKYSDMYAKPDKQRNKYMFLVKVLCGKWDCGRQEYKRPPPVDPTNLHSELYDCCVENVDDPKIFCVFDKNQYYPYYLIKYI